MDGPGTITWEEFVNNCEDLVKLSDVISDRWTFLGEKEQPGQAYLSREEKIFVPYDYPIDDEQLENGIKSDYKSNEEWSVELDTCIDPFEASHVQKRPLIIEHHILWSMSYSVPVIYFNGWKSDSPGINPVSVEVAQKLIVNEKLAYNELSQAIHPLLARPFLHLHPCGSRELLRTMNKSANKVVSWLSVIAPVALRLNLPHDYYKLTLTNGNG